MFLLTLTPNADRVTIPISLLAEFFAYAGLGLILVMGIATVAARVVHITVQRTGQMQEGISAQTLHPPLFTSPKMEIYKPSQLRTASGKKTTDSASMEEPVLENDAMDILRAESDSQKRTIKKGQTPAQPPTHAPMSELSDFSGFENTLAQLKRDLKDFNESMKKTHSHEENRI
jgi:hypothetical protein